MKNLLMTLLFLGTITSVARATRQDPQNIPENAPATFGDAGSFYSPLSPYGEWLEIDPGFYAWRPTHVRADWRPYTYGHWAWTDFGWYWISDEPYGWAVYHYGRWYDDESYGWIWIPDRTWAPAWVEWRYNDDYLGWAPLPPYATFNFHIGIRFTTHWFAPYHYWNFVRYRSFGSAYIAREIVPIEFTRRLIGSTRTGGRYDFDGGRLINRGIDRGFVERRGGTTRIARTDVRETGLIGERVVRNRNEERIEVYRPDRLIAGRTPEHIDARKPERGTTLELRKVERAPRESGRTLDTREVDRGRTVTRQESQPPPDRSQRPEITERREENVQRPRVEQKIVLPQGPTVERREAVRRSEDHAPAARRDQAPQRQERRVMAPSRPQSEQRHENPTSKPHAEQRPAPGQTHESPRGTEQNRKEGGRRKD